VCLRAVPGHGVLLSGEGEAVLVECVEEIKDDLDGGKCLSR
jgi:hypothetical protein